MKPDSYAPISMVLKNLAGSIRISDEGVQAFLNAKDIEHPHSAKTTKFHRRFIDRYSSPRGYCDWQKAVRAFCKYITPKYIYENLRPYTVEDTGTIENRNASLWPYSGKIGMNLSIPMLTTAYFKKIPTYYITKEMAVALANTDVPPQGIPEKVIDSFFICLPINFLKDALGLDHLGLDCLLVTSRAGFSYGVKTAGRVFSYKTNITLAEEDDFHDLYFINCGKGALIGSGIDWAESLDLTNQVYFGGPGETTKPQKCANDFLFPGSAQIKIRNLIKNIILIYNYEKNYLQHDPSPNVISGKRHAGKRIKAEYPISWIGKNFRCKTVQSDKSSDQGSRRVFKSHWRRGHWHHYWAGAGRRQSVLRWVQPVYVRGLNMHS